jgi:ubiquinone/menaquinone biosynthesis C-methylase UbiE
MFLAGFIGIAVVAVAELGSFPGGLTPWIYGLGVLVANYGILMGSYMTYASRMGKLRTRERLLDLAGQLRPWSGAEKVLDVGCGRGLMLVGAARRLTSGNAVGIDLWRAEDQTGNSPDAAQTNARCEGVSDRIRVDTGDARQLPYADGSFDLVLSHWVVHNIPLAVDRERALGEMLRVLRTGGVLVLADIANVEEYRTYLLSKGVKGLRFVDGGAEAAIMGALSGGSYRPQALLALRP